MRARRTKRSIFKTRSFHISPLRPDNNNNRSVGKPSLFRTTREEETPSDVKLLMRIIVVAVVVIYYFLVRKVVCSLVQLGGTTSPSSIEVDEPARKRSRKRFIVEFTLRAYISLSSLNPARLTRMRETFVESDNYCVGSNVNLRTGRACGVCADVENKNALRDLMGKQNGITNKHRRNLYFIARFTRSHYAPTACRYDIIIIICVELYFPIKQQQ